MSANKNMFTPPLNQFTPEELEQIKKLSNPEYNSELVSEQIKEIFGEPELLENNNKEYPINVLNNKPEITEFEQYVSIDPNTGLHTPVSKNELNQSLGEDISLDEIERFDINDIEIKDSDAESLTNLFGIDLKDSMKLINLIREVKNGNDKSIFSKLPDSMKHQLQSICGNDRANLNKAAKDFINMAISQIGTDQAFVDLEKGIKDATQEMVDGYKGLAKEASQIEDDDYNIRLKLYIDNLDKEIKRWQKIRENSSLSELYHEMISDDKFFKKISDYNNKVIGLLEINETNCDTALSAYINDMVIESDKWNNVRNKYLSAISFSELKEAIKANPKLTKKLDKYSRMTRDFNHKYTSETKKTKFACRDINYATNVLARILDPKEYPNDLIKKFICVICNYTKNFDATDIVDHTFMYFTVKTIVSIETFNYTDKEYIDRISLIKEVLDLLKEV